MQNLMDHNTLFQRMADYQMTFMNNSINALSIFQDRNEKAIEMLANQVTWAAEKWKGAVVDWNKAYQDGIRNFGKIVEDNLAKVRNCSCNE